MNDFTISKTVFIKAPADAVWRFLTERDKLAAWFHEGEQDFKSKGIWAVLSDSAERQGERICWGEILEYTPTTRLVHTFTHSYLNEVETRCEWLLTEVDGGTVLKLTHTGFEKVENGFDMAADHDEGWDEHFARLRKLPGQEKTG